MIGRPWVIYDHGKRKRFSKEDRTHSEYDRLQRANGWLVYGEIAWT